MLSVPFYVTRHAGTNQEEDGLVIDATFVPITQADGSQGTGILYMVLWDKSRQGGAQAVIADDSLEWSSVPGMTDVTGSVLEDYFFEDKPEEAIAEEPSEE